jgi:lipid II:glycine glycyltransferase (peptidoglycan interpeptide bridge formation enzyme)
MILRDSIPREEWNTAAAKIPGAHILQSWEWGECKARFGWTVDRRLWIRDDQQPCAAAQILRRQVRFGPFSETVLYVPKGPLLDWQDPPVRDAVLSWMESLARRERTIQIKIDPDLVVGTGEPDTPGDSPNQTGSDILALLRHRGWRFSREQIQFRNSVILDIRPEEETLLARMKQKTRYNIRLAQKHGVTVRAGSREDLPLLYQMYAETANRDGFVIRSGEYYADIWQTMMQAGFAQPLIAEVEGLPVAALILFRFAGRGWFFYGMSRDMHREKMPNYLLQWEAIRWLRRHGVSDYDFWGAPDEFSGTDPLWGVYKFKQGYGAEVVRHIGAWDYTASPLRYAAYNTMLPRVLDLTRALARRRTRAIAENA